MHEVAVESPRPIGEIRTVAVARGDHDALRLDAAVGGDEIPGFAVAVNALDFDAGPHNDACAVGITPQVLDHAVAGRPLPKNAWHAISGEA